jgi:hypothetical protein
MGGREEQGAAEGAFGDAELDDGPIVPEIGGFALQDDAGEQSGGFDDITFAKMGEGLGA